MTGQELRGYIQIYTGSGKGKTTAAVGQAVRAAGAGYRSLIIQFMKEYPYSEVKAIRSYLKEFITVEQYAGDDFVYRKELPQEHEITKARKGLKRAKDALLNKEFDLVILDEILVSTYFKLIETEEIIELIRRKPEDIELILTGRYCPPEIIELADLVTEMKEVKHYYQKGVLSRRGIDS